MRSSNLFHMLKQQPDRATSDELLKLKQKFELLERQEPAFSDDQPASSSPVEQEVKASVSEQDKIAIEESRLKIMKEMLAYLKENGDTQKKDPLQEAVPQSSTKWWAKPVYVFLMLFNVLFMAIGGFLGAREILVDIISYLSPVIINLISGCLAACECAMSYSISSPYVKKGLGLPEDEIARTIAIIQNEQCQTTEAINAKLLSPQYYQSMTPSDYSEYTKLSSLFNDYISNIKPIEFQEPVFKKRIRLFFTAVNMVLMMTNSFYMTTALLKVVAATLVGTPIGWAMIAGVILIQLAATSIMRSESMFEMLNPEVVKIKEANKRIKSFKNKTKDFYLIGRQKQRLNNVCAKMKNLKRAAKVKSKAVKPKLPARIFSGFRVLWGKYTIFQEPTYPVGPSEQFVQSRANSLP
ncbi:MAG: hypothetical protein K0S63_975 [Gammaproteobacteria bacterium]|nr:hypothetical protein [Gammaproteobacteria bacterium]